MFLDEIKENKALFRKIAAGRKLSAKENELLEDIKRRHGISDSGTVATQEALAELMGKTRQTIIRWKKDGMPTEPDGSYDPIKVLEWRSELGDDIKLGDKSKWETEFRMYRSLLMEVEYKKAIGEVISRSEVERLLVERATELKKSLIGRGRRLAPRIAHKDVRQCQEILVGDSMEILRAYSRPNGITGGNHGGEKDADFNLQGGDALSEVWQSDDSQEPDGA